MDLNKGINICTISLLHHQNVHGGREGGRERGRPGCSLNGVCQKRSMHKVRDKKTKKRSMHMVRDKKTKLVQVIF